MTAYSHHYLITADLQVSQKFLRRVDVTQVTEHNEINVMELFLPHPP